MENNEDGKPVKNVTGEICWNEKDGICIFWAYDSVFGYNACLCDKLCIRKKIDIEKPPI